MKNKHKIFILGIILGYTIVAPMIPFFLSTSDREIMSKVVKLDGNGHSCSGEQVKAASGKDYILSAAHCKVTQQGDSIEVITEDGKILQRRVIAEDKNSDLLLIEGLPGVSGLPLANSTGRFQAVRTFTHGKGLPTYKTEGRLIGETEVQIMVGPIANGAEEEACKAMPKNKVVGEAEIKFCILSVQEVATTASIVPGSSGGPIVDSDGALLGVASAKDDFFGYLVPLSDIKAFLKNY